MTQHLLLSGNSAVMLTVTAADGRILASSFEGRDGWHVTARLPRGGVCQIFVESEADARLLLAAVGEALGDE